MIDIKIAFFDLDGTLLNDKKEITLDTCKSLEYLKSKNITLVLATGRFDAYAIKYADKLKVIDYIIANNGALIYDVKNKKYIYEQYLDNTLVNNLWNYTYNNRIGITLNTKGKRYSNIYSTTSENLNVVINDLSILDKEVYQIVFTSFHKSNINKLLNYLKDIPVDITYISNSYYSNNKSSISVDINIKDTNKAVAAIKLMEILNIDSKYSICFGDGINDIDIFNACNIKVAMENGKKELKDKATYITLSNNNEGVSHFIINYIK